MAAAKQVHHDADGFWLSAGLAMGRLGCTRADLIALVATGEIRCKDEDRKGYPLWYSEEDVSRLAKAKLAAKRAAPPQPAKPKRRMTDKQVEAMHTRIWKQQAKTVRYGGNMGPVGLHKEQVILREIAEKARKKDKSES